MPLKETKFHLPANIKELFTEKRKLRKVWHNTRYPQDKTKLNKVAKKLNKMLHELKNENLKNKLKTFTTDSINYSLWKVTKRLKQPQATIPLIRKQDGNWARSTKAKALAFAEHMKKVFTPHPRSTDTNYYQIYEY